MFFRIIFLSLMSLNVLMATPFSFNVSIPIEAINVKQAQFIKASDGIKLAYYSFVPTNPRSIMIFYHGGGAWSMPLYQYMAQQLEQKYKIGTYLFDIRGHGNSQGPRGDAPSSEQVWRDITTAIDFVKIENPNAQIYLGGHSSGAGLILNYSCWSKQKSIEGYVLLAPFLGSRSGTSYDHSDPEKRFVKDVRFIPLIINILTGGYFFAHTHVIFFNYPQEQKQRDHYLLDSYTCSMATATTPSDPKKLFDGLQKPFFMIIGQCDEQFDPAKTLVYADFAKQVKNDSGTKCVSGATHLSIVVDAIDDVASWINNHKLDQKA